MRFRIIVGGVSRDDMANPAEHPAATDPQAGRDDEPEDAPQPLAIVYLSDARNDETENGSESGIFHSFKV